jgi:ADP-ribose pyrophosphatase
VPEPLESVTVFQGDWIRVDIETWPGSERYEVVHEHDAAAVLPMTPEGDVLLVRQFRPPIRRRLLEIPAGKLDVDGEDAMTCATRELWEETGYRHRAIGFLGGCYTSAGSTSEYVHLFWAKTSSRAEGTPEPEIELVREPFDKMLKAARDGKVRDAKTSMALLLAASGSRALPG